MMTGMAGNWEYRQISSSYRGDTQDHEVWMTLLQAAGSIGWELVSVWPVQTGVYAMLKREAPALPPPAETKIAGWLTDPTGRYELRHWDGLRWTQHVSTAGSTEVDFPTVEA